jgi:hypothetical protein
MALVLNGSGSITGLSAGGLPDGSVTADDIASTLDLSGKTVTLPSGVGGKVLQAVYDYTTATASTSSTSFTNTGFSLSITPTDATTKMLVMLSAYMGSTRTDQNIYTGSAQLYETTTSTALPGASGGFGHGVHFDNDTASARVAHHVVGSVLHDHNTASTLTYKVQFKALAATVYINTPDGSTNDWGSTTLTILEIAA